MPVCLRCSHPSIGFTTDIGYHNIQTSLFADRITTPALAHHARSCNRATTLTCVNSDCFAFTSDRSTDTCKSV